MIKWAELSARERDWLVATRVFPGQTFARPGEWPGLDVHGVDRAPLPLFTSDISAAWTVVEKMESEDDRVVKYGTHGVRTGPRVVVLDVEGRIRGHAEGNTAPEVICIAALRACGVEIDV